MAEEKSRQIINIVIVVVILAVVALSYLYFKNKDSDLDESMAPEVVIAQPVVNISGMGVSLNSLQLISLIKKLQSISVEMKVDIVNADDFKSLKDFTVLISEEDYGIKNPFGDKDDL